MSDEQPSDNEGAEDPIDLRRTLDTDDESSFEEIIRIIVEPVEIQPVEGDDNGKTSSEEVIRMIVEPDPNQSNENEEINASPITVQVRVGIDYGHTSKYMFLHLNLPH